MELNTNDLLQRGENNNPLNDQKLLEQNAHISTAEVMSDIRETEREIADLQRETEHLAATPLSLPSARFDHMRAEARLTGIAKRREFIAKLQQLLSLRGEAESV